MNRTNQTLTLNLRTGMVGERAGREPRTQRLNFERLVFSLAFYSGTPSVSQTEIRV